MSDRPDIHPIEDALQTDLARLRQQVSEKGVLLEYQKRYLREAKNHSLVVVEKSRRIGLTWAEAGDDALFAATDRKHGGDDVSYIGYNLEMAREYIQAVGSWARAFNYAASAVREEIFNDAAPGEEDKFIKAFRIDFASGHKIIALSSKPRSLRGRRGRVVIDEAAFHDDVMGIIDAALALLVWGGQVRVISTHFGASNAFNQLITEIRSGKRKGHVFRCTFDEAVADGLYERVCLVKGSEPTAQGKQDWIDEVRGAYGEAAKEELDCIPSKSAGAFLPLTLLEAQAEDVPVLRYEQNNDFTMLPPHIREADCRAWCEEHLLPQLIKLEGGLEHCAGSDFARSGDLSVVWIIAILKTMQRKTPFTVEMRNIPYDQQKQILFYILERLPRFRKAVLDSTGNGEYMGEVTMQKYGEGRVVALKLSTEWYRENMPKMKSALEDQVFFIPRDSDTINDMHMFKVEDGVAKMPKSRTGTGTSKRHGDAGVAGALAYWATTLDPAPIEFLSTGNVRGDIGQPEKVDIGFGAVSRRNGMSGY